MLIISMSRDKDLDKRSRVSLVISNIQLLAIKKRRRKLLFEMSLMIADLTCKNVQSLY